MSYRAEPSRVEPTCRDTCEPAAQSRRRRMANKSLVACRARCALDRRRRSDAAGHWWVRWGAPADPAEARGAQGRCWRLQCQWHRRRRWLDAQLNRVRRGRPTGWPTARLAGRPAPLDALHRSASKCKHLPPDTQHPTLESRKPPTRQRHDSRAPLVNRTSQWRHQWLAGWLGAAVWPGALLSRRVSCNGRL